MWRLWCKALGQKATECNKESDRVAIIRTIILVAYMTANAFIMAGVIRHWNDDTITQLEVQVMVQDK